MTFQPLKNYLQNKEKRENTPFRISPHGSGFLIANHIVSEREFKEMLPLGDKVTLWNHYEKGENPDKYKI